MTRKHAVRAAAVLALAAAAAALAQDPLDLARRKDFAALRSSSNNPDPQSNDDSKRPIPGETIVLADLVGPGVVNHIWLTVAANEYGWPRLLRFRVYYDGSATPSVDAPLGDFFAVGHGQERPVHSIMVRNVSSGRSRNSYWAMPFRKSCRITVTNEGRRRVSNLYYHVDWSKLRELPPDALYFHARYRQELPATRGKLYDVLDVRGSGHFAGAVLNVVQAESGWFGEGDDLFYVDGEEKPVIEGTGTEDYFNDAWSLRVDSGPYAGVAIAEGKGVGSRLSAYRWHVTDPVPFTRSLRLAFEHGGWTYHADGTARSAFEERADLFSSVAFWYQEGIAQGLAEPPFGAARLPHGNARQIEAEAAIAQVTAERGKASVDKEVFWSRDLLRLRADGPGAKIHIPFEVDEDGEYELMAQVAHAPFYGVYTTLLDGSPLVTDVGLDRNRTAPIDAYHTEMYVAADHLLSWKKLARGRHVLTFECTGKNGSSRGYDLGVDTLVLARIARPEAMGGARAAAMRHASDAAMLRGGLTDADPVVREAAASALSQQAALSAELAAPLAAALRDASPVVRGLAARALLGCGNCARQAFDPLVAALRDPDENVRIAAADAIAVLGSGAAPALKALIDAAGREGEAVHVQRSVAAALGAIGPAALPAIPVLERLRESVRVRWPAEAAIRRIKGLPPR